MNITLKTINMKQYLSLLTDIKENGTNKPGAREGLPGTKAVFGPQIHFNLQKGFPIITTKAVSFNNIVVELLWFLKGGTNIKYMVDRGLNIWNEDAYNYFCKLFPDVAEHKTIQQFIEDVKLGVRFGDYKCGDTGNQYPKTWRHFGSSITTAGIDQISNVINNLQKIPFGRRHLVNSIDVQRDQDLALYWCHALFQFNVTLPYVDGPYYLDCKLYQRSADVILGVPYNISSYALLTSIIARLCTMETSMFIHSFGDLHLYDNHKEAADLQLTRTPHELPKLMFTKEFDDLISLYHQGDMDLDSFFYHLQPKMFWLDGYTHDTPIKATLNTGMKKIEFENGSSIETKGDEPSNEGRSIEDDTKR